MTLPFDVDNTGCHMPPTAEIRHIFKQLKYYQDDYLVFPHFASIHTDAFKIIYIYMLLTNFTIIGFNTTTTQQIFPENVHPPPAWKL